MAIGLNPSKAEIDTACGLIGRDLQAVMDKIDNFKYWLDAKQDSDLTALGYSSTDITNMRSAFADAAQLYTVYQGTASVAVAKDFRTFLRRVWGLGNL